MRALARFLESLFRHAVVYPCLRLLLRNPPVGLPVGLRTFQRILILRYDRIGDMVVTTPIFRALKEAHPRARIGVLASPSNAAMIDANPYVDRIHVLHRNVFSLGKEILAARREGYDLVLNFIFNRTTSAGMLSNVIAPRAVKIGQGDDKYRFYFNAMLKLVRGSMHMTEILAGILRSVFGIDVAANKLRLEVFADDAARDAVTRYCEGKKLGIRGKKGRSPGYLVLNLSSTEGPRQLSDEQARTILRLLSRTRREHVVVIASPEEKRRRMRLTASMKNGRVHSFPDEGDARIQEIFCLIRGARGVITPDTSIVHLASAARTPLFGLYSPLQVYTEWTPFRLRHRMVLAEKGQPVASIGPEALRRELRTFLERIA